MSTIISLQTILWSALAAAAGIGLPVLVFWYGSSNSAGVQSCFLLLSAR